MLIRIVQLTIKQQSQEEFEFFFRQNKQTISSFKGCQSVKLLKDIQNENGYFTISEWLDSDHLQEYRNSDFFKNIWPKAKGFFSSPAKAWSTIEAGL